MRKAFGVHGSEKGSAVVNTNIILVRQNQRILRRSNSKIPADLVFRLLSSVALLQWLRFGMGPDICKFEDYWYLLLRLVSVLLLPTGTSTITAGYYI